MDLDLRPDQWQEPWDFGLNIRTILPSVDVIIGTEEEFFALLDPEPATIMEGKPVSRAQREALSSCLAELLGCARGAPTLVVKRSERGVSVYRAKNEVIHTSGFKVEVLNTVGAGDAFASGLIYGYLQGWEWQRCCQMGNACGALTVTRHGCSAVFPTRSEAIDFINSHGDF
jgi:5-dehydro-2-deoxygluconokinase